MSSSIIRTVVGDISADEARRPLTHEHLIFSREDTPGAADALRRLRARMDRDMATLAATGCNLLTDVSPIGYLRWGDLFRRVYGRTGIRVVAATGGYAERYLPAWFARLSADRMAERLTREVEEGIAGQGMRAGILKAASGYRTPEGPGERLFHAVVAAHRCTGAPITCHSFPGLAAHAAFFRAQRLDPEKVALGHVEANAWPDVRAAARAGWMLCFTNLGSERVVPDDVAQGQIVALLRRGHLRQILLSSDFRYRIRGGVVRAVWPHRRYDHVFTGFAPRLRALGVSARDLEVILEENPRRFLAFRARV